MIDKEFTFFPLGQRVLVFGTIGINWEYIRLDASTGKQVSDCCWDVIYELYPTYKTLSIHNTEPFEAWVVGQEIKATGVHAAHKSRVSGNLDIDPLNRYPKQLVIDKRHVIYKIRTGLRNKEYKCLESQLIILDYKDCPINGKKPKYIQQKDTKLLPYYPIGD